MGKYANGTGRLLLSYEAETAADEIVRKIRLGEMKMDILPNTHEVFYSELEEEAYLSFCRFLGSHNGQAVIQRIELGEKLGNGRL